MLGWSRLLTITSTDTTAFDGDVDIVVSGLLELKVDDLEIGGLLAVLDCVSTRHDWNVRMQVVDLLMDLIVWWGVWWGGKVAGRKNKKDVVRHSALHMFPNITTRSRVGWKASVQAPAVSD